MSQTVQGALRHGVSALTGAGIDGAAGDARRLMAFALGVEAGRITLLAQDVLRADQQQVFEAAITRRCAREPLSHITGTRAFYGRSFGVTPDVLDPRPDTETLISAALEVPFDTVLDLGTGSGAILVTLLAERPGATGVGADISPAALAVARDNGTRLGVEPRVVWQESDWCARIDGVFDLIVSNPPYIASAEMDTLSPEVLREPRIALTDEADGLSAYRMLVEQTPDHLAPGGWLMVEIGWQQGADVAALMRHAGFVGVTIRADLDGRDRVVLGQKG